MNHSVPFLSVPSHAPLSSTPSPTLPEIGTDLPAPAAFIRFFRLFFFSFPHDQTNISGLAGFASGTLRIKRPGWRGMQRTAARDMFHKCFISLKSGCRKFTSCQHLSSGACCVQRPSGLYCQLSTDSCIFHASSGVSCLHRLSGFAALSIESFIPHAGVSCLHRHSGLQRCLLSRAFHMLERVVFTDIQGCSAVH